METPVNTNEITTRSVGIRYGVFLGAFGAVIFLATSLLGIDVSDGGAAWAYRIVSLGASGVIIYLAHEYFKKEGNGFMTMGQGFGIGFWAGLISSSISSAFLYVYVKFVDSSFVDLIREKQLAEMEAKGMSEENIQQAMAIAGMFTSPEAILIFGIIGGIFFSLVVALIVSIFTQKRNPDAVPF